MFSNFRSTIFLGIANSECFSLCLYITPKKTQVWVHKMSYKLVINQFFLQCQVATTLYPPVWNAVCSRLPSCSFMFFFELEKIRNISRLKFTLTIHSLYQLRLVLPLHKNHHIICRANQQDGFYTMVTLLIPGTNFFKYRF